jgi:MraZ protein
MLFLGRYEYAMDDRGRIPMPPRFRDALVQGIILTQGAPDHCVRAFSLEGFDQQADLYMTAPSTQREGRVLRRAFFARAYSAELDRQGRVLIPPPLRRWASLESEVVVVGTGEGIEIWDAKAFDDAMAAEESEFERALGTVQQLRAPGN